MSAVHSQSSSDALIVISANIEGLTANEASIVSELCKDKHCHCLCLQETHGAKDHARPSIPGMTLVAERPHNKHGSSVFVRDGLKVNSISVCEEDNVEFITVELPGVVVYSVYKPPAEQFLFPPLESKHMPHIVIGDFNSHNTLSSSISNMCEKYVVDPIPQHRPIGVRVNLVIVAHPTTFRRRFNLKKADLEGFSADLDSTIEEVVVIPENYERFIEPFCETTIDTGNKLIDKMKDEKMKSWEEVITSNDLTHNSRA